VLALHAHPDDVEFQCAGTLVLLKEAGCHVTIATMTPGACGSAEHDAEAISAIRREQARRLSPGRPGWFPTQAPHRSVLAQLRHTAPHVTFATGRHTEWIAIAGGSG
jgi:hypothetical protein